MSEEALKAELLNTADDQLKKQPEIKVTSTIKTADVDLAELHVQQ
jgi:hypothetical protein